MVLPIGENIMSIKQNIIKAVVVERYRQDAQWGGIQHDIEHDDTEWLHYIDRQSKKYLDTVSSGMDDPDFIRCMVKINALSMAAIETAIFQYPELEDTLIDMAVSMKDLQNDVIATADKERN
jgi:hypothetical protein